MQNKKTKILFICKKRYSSYGISYGLINSCKFICNALKKFGIESKLVEVIDNNKIDHEVHIYKPTHVFIEALWVVPEKFKVLLPRYKSVKWFVRLHSNTPFLANEGIALEWLKKYEDIKKQYPNFHIAANSKKIIKDFKLSLGMDILYAPNIYFPSKKISGKFKKNSLTDKIDIGCFGSIRPLKNHLIQAMAAMAVGNKLNKQVNFYVNDRVEQNGDSIFKNLVNLFNNTNHSLKVQKWVDHDDFVRLVKTMDIGMQVSFSETFNIVAADMVYNDIPVVGSKEIDWLFPLYQVKNPNNIKEIIRKTKLALFLKPLKIHFINKITLMIWNIRSVFNWLALIG